MKLFAKSLLIVLAASAVSVAIAAQRRMPLEMLCRHSERIVIAEVTGAKVIETDWPNLGKGILTTTVFTLQVKETWKGATSESLEIEVVGGTNPETGVTTEVSGTPKFRIGEKALVFVDETGGKTQVYGWQQGRYEVVVQRVVGRPGMPIEEDILTYPLKKRIDAILAAQAAEPKVTPEKSPTDANAGGR